MKEALDSKRSDLDEKKGYNMRITNRRAVRVKDQAHFYLVQECVPHKGVGVVEPTRATVCSSTTFIIMGRQYKYHPLYSVGKFQVYSKDAKLYYPNRYILFHFSSWDTFWQVNLI